MNNNHPLISIVVPVYMVEKYIHQCIESILSQTYTHFELILVDDGSPDASGMICDNYKRKDNRIIVIHQKNGGLSDARNTAINVAKGKYITFIDSDDCVSTKYLEILLKTAILYHADIVQAEETNNFYLIDKKHKKKTLFFDSGDKAFQNHIGKHDIKDMACSKLYKTALFSDIRYPVGKLHEDTRTTYKLCRRANKVVCINNYLYFYRINPEGIMHGKLSAGHFTMHNVPKEIEIFLGTEAPQYKKELCYYQMKTDIAIYNMYIRARQEFEYKRQMTVIINSLKKRHIGEKSWDIKYKILINILRIHPALYKAIVLHFKNGI